MIKCKFCNHERFEATQISSERVVIDGEKQYIDQVSNSYTGDEYTGPFICLNCEATFPTLEEFSSDYVASDDFTKRQIDEYLNSKGLLCPFCKSDELDVAESLEADGDAAYSLILCRSCNQTWEEIWKVSSITKSME